MQWPPTRPGLKGRKFHFVPAAFNTSSVSMPSSLASLVLHSAAFLTHVEAVRRGKAQPQQEIEFVEAGRTIWLEVNGTTQQSSDVDKLIWNIREIIADLSTYYHLQPGDLIYTGTPEGVGAVVTGDTITGRVEGVAELSLTIGAAA